MQKRFILGISLLVILTSPVWFFVLRNEVTAFQLKAELRNAFLPDGTKIISSSSRVYNSGNGDGCDYQAIVIVEHFGPPDTLQSSYMDLFETIFNEEPRIVQTDNPAEWFAKLSSQPTEFSIALNTDTPPRYMVSATI